jgi:hypothetical protein
MTDASAIELYYDPFDFEIDDDPYSIWKRMRDEAPLYHNERFNFYALSRYEDVARELPNWETTVRVTARPWTSSRAESRSPPG